jgi:hypothetical protein
VDYEVKRQLLSLARDRRDGLSDQKGAEYTKTGQQYQEGGDILANFKRNAERFKVNPITVLGVYMGKHFDSIENFISEIVQCESYEDAVTKVMEGEGIISRIDDAANYLDLLEALLFEYNLHPFSFALDGEAVEDEPEESLDVPDDEDVPEASSPVDLDDLIPFRGSHETGIGGS